jgi:hypothetical protein
MSEVTDLTVIEIKPEQAPALYSAGGLNGFLEQIRELAKEVPDVPRKKAVTALASWRAWLAPAKQLLSQVVST